MDQFIPENDHRPTVTEEQLEWFSRQTSRAVNTAVRRAMRIYTKAALTGFCILLLGLILTIYVIQDYDEESRRAIVDSGRAISAAGCNRDFDSISKDRALLVRGRKNIEGQYGRNEITRKAYEQALVFYDNELRNYKLPDCRQALDAVTDNPDEPILIPGPRFPGDGK